MELYVKLNGIGLYTSTISSLLSFTDLAPVADSFPAGLMLGGPLDKGTGNKYGPIASACYAKEPVCIDAFGILSPIDLPSALHIYTF